VLPNTGIAVLKVARGGLDGMLFTAIAPKSFNANPGEKIKLMEFQAWSNQSGFLQMFVIPRE
jgi:hypothetical protein